MHWKHWVRFPEPGVVKIIFNLRKTISLSVLKSFSGDFTQQKGDTCYNDKLYTDRYYLSTGACGLLWYRKLSWNIWPVSVALSHMLTSQSVGAIHWLLGKRVLRMRLASVSCILLFRNENSGNLYRNIGFKKRGWFFFRLSHTLWWKY